MKKVLIGIILGIGITTVGCVSANSTGDTSSPPGDSSSTHSGERQNKFEYKSTNYGNVKILIDKDTGLEYIEVNGKAITPRYDSSTTKYTNIIIGTP